MDKKMFCDYMHRLYQDITVGNSLNELLGADVTGEGFLGSLIDDFGSLILDSASNGKEISDELYEGFWNCASGYPCTWTNEEIGGLYNAILREGGE